MLSPSTTEDFIDQLPNDEGSEPVKLTEQLRSLSTPDLKNTGNGSDYNESSPYVSIEALSFRGQNGNDDDSDPGSADEMDKHVLKTFKRPLRPAANKTSSSRYLSRHRDEQLVMPKEPPPNIIASSASLAAQIRAKASAFKTAIKQSEKVFGAN